LDAACGMAETGRCIKSHPGAVFGSLYEHNVNCWFKPKQSGVLSVPIFRVVDAADSLFFLSTFDTYSNEDSFPDGVYLEEVELLRWDTD
jgi:hypothetical protein